MKIFFLLCVALVLVAGCGKHSERTLGAAVQGTPLSVAKLSDAETDGPFLLEGTMTKKCPVAGCWFVLTDKTGTIKVDLKNSEFVVVDVPLNAHIAVAGRLSTNDTGLVLEASGMRF
jgi:uncharacterized protein YdeI (BOF family)